MPTPRASYPNQNQNMYGKLYFYCADNTINFIEIYRLDLYFLLLFFSQFISNVLSLVERKICKQGNIFFKNKKNPDDLHPAQKNDV
jgi:hypothetical protein